MKTPGSCDFDLNAYDYVLPSELIAQAPANPRDSSRLMVLHRAEKRWEHRNFCDLPEYLDQNDLVIANNTEVIKARLLGTRLRLEGDHWVPGGRVEFLLLEEKSPRVWEGLMHASARYVPGLRFQIPVPNGPALNGVLIRGTADSTDGTVTAEFDRDPLESGAGELPLPHYIDSNGSSGHHYQTIYSKFPGSAAAPTAGLHFTPAVLGALKKKRISWSEVTLHVGLGTFRPVKTEDITTHAMHEERYDVSIDVAQKVTQWKKERKRILAVGTTSTRTLESAWEQDHLRAGQGRTSIFIYPGSTPGFQVVDRLLTNFHLPRSTLLMLISAFAGREFILEAYEEAIRMRYRFFSYGDSMLILE
jgi:S-adenosylmethionine:tRNA ribosyltransferase-isomerase